LADATNLDGKTRRGHRFGQMNHLLSGDDLIVWRLSEWPDGRVTWALTSKMPFYNSCGEIIGTLGISKNITAFKEAEEKVEQLHRQLLAFSRKQMMQSQPFDLNKIILNLNKMLERIIGEDIDLQCHFTAGLPRVQADIGMIEQVLVNLVVNARDAMPDGGQLVITTKSLTFNVPEDFSHSEGRPGAFVCLEVKDAGAGISPENLSRIFEPFFTTKDVGKGTGLGLATVYGIVKQHGGWIDVSSQVGAGSTFRIFLPALEGAGRASIEQTPQAGLPCGKETVLRVEEEASVRSVTRRLLERSGYHVLEAGSGPELCRTALPRRTSPAA
jgi:PAS domain-containing protein